MSKNVDLSRFLSTAIFEEDAHKYAKKVLWHIKVPKGSKGSMIEGYNVERAATYNRLKTGTAETDDHLTLSHKL